MDRMTRAAITPKPRNVPARVRPPSANAPEISPEARERMIREAAYYRYVHRGFAHGHDLEDWLAAEAAWERAMRRRLPERPEPLEEMGMQLGGPRSPAEDDVLKRMVKQHPRRDIARMESVEPEEAPPKQ